MATYCAFLLAELGVVDEEGHDPGLVQGHDAREMGPVLLRTSSLALDVTIDDFQYF